MYPLDDPVLVLILMVLSLIIWWRQVIRLLVGIMVLLVVLGLVTMISAVQAMP